MKKTVPSSSVNANLRIKTDRLMDRIFELGKIGALEGGGVSRLALTDADKDARNRVVAWMRELGLTVQIDGIGNVVGTRAGSEEGPPVMMGSHIDTVKTGGLYDGSLGVLSGLEVVEVLNDAGVTTRRPLAVAAFTKRRRRPICSRHAGKPCIYRRAFSRGSLRHRRHRR